MGLNVREQAVLRDCEGAAATDSDLWAIACFFNLVHQGEPMPCHERAVAWQPSPNRCAVARLVAYILAYVWAACRAVGHFALEAARDGLQTQAWYLPL